MITADDFKKRLDVINAYWKVMCKYVKCTGTEEECDNLVSDVDKLHAVLGKTPFSKEIGIAVVNEIDRIMKMNKKQEEK